MSIPAGAQPPPTVAPNFKIAWSSVESGIPSQTTMQFLQQLYSQFVSTNRIIPCNATGTNVIALTFLPSSPLVVQYSDFDTYGFVAQNTSTGPVTANVTTAQGALGTIKVFKTNGSAQAGSGDVTANLQYFLTYVDSLDAGNGGFVLR